jgi:general secretion pathway protein D
VVDACAIGILSPIKLTIKPAIRPDSDAVRMELELIVKQPSNANIRSQDLLKSTTIISNRTVKTNIVVNHGDTAVLGGLVRDEDSVQERKVPILGDIPVLGWLFKSSEVQRKKVNLVSFITPKIIRNKQDSQQLLTEKTNKRIDWIKRNYDGRDPYGATVDKLPRAAITAEDQVDHRKSNKEPIRRKRITE